ncbi:MAG TPA: zinc-binding dehydrogenase [Streptosporangiaceae bacterium]|jgi:NADPH:quinone reductase-like Zn-dependent oxidoreductase
MLAAYASKPSPDDPLAGLDVGEQPEPSVPAGWVRVRMRAASLNMHDVITLRGVRLRPDQFPMILGCDGAGVLDDGTEVVILPSVNAPGWAGEERLDPDRTMLTEHYQGSFAQLVAVPARNVVPKPASVSFAEAACTGTAWLTAYRMLFVSARLRPGTSIAVQGRLGSISVALVRLGAAAGMRVWVAGTGVATAAGRLGAAGTFDPADGPPAPVDAVFDAGTDEAEWSHAVPWLRPGGTIVCGGNRSGRSRAGYSMSALDLLMTIEGALVGSGRGTRDDLTALLAFLDRAGVRPGVARELPLERAREALAAMAAGATSGKIVLTMPA